MDNQLTDRVRKIITGSATPATDILALDDLTRDEFSAANRYFAYGHGIFSTAAAERNYCVVNDC